MNNRSLSRDGKHYERKRSSSCLLLVRRLVLIHIDCVTENYFVRIGLDYTHSFKGCSEIKSESHIEQISPTCPETVRRRLQRNYDKYGKKILHQMETSGRRSRETISTIQRKRSVWWDISKSSGTE